MRPRAPCPHCNDVGRPITKSSVNNDRVGKLLSGYVIFGKEREEGEEECYHIKETTYEIPLRRPTRRSRFRRSHVVQISYRTYNGWANHLSSLSLSKHYQTEQRKQLQNAIRPNKKIVSGLRARHFQTSASMLFVFFVLFLK